MRQAIFFYYTKYEPALSSGGRESPPLGAGDLVADGISPVGLTGGADAAICGRSPVPLFAARFAVTVAREALSFGVRSCAPGHGRALAGVRHGPRRPLRGRSFGGLPWLDIP